MVAPNREDIKHYTYPYDWATLVAREMIPGHQRVTIRGYATINAGAFFDIAPMGNLTYLTAATQLNIGSTDPDDNATGNGLRQLRMFGVDGLGMEVTEDVKLNGLTAVRTVNSYLRVNAMQGLLAGRSGYNEGTVTAKTLGLPILTQSQMEPTIGVSETSHFTVPLGKTFYFLGAELNASRSGGSLPVVDFHIQARIGGDGFCWVTAFRKRMDASVVNQLIVNDLPIPNGLLAQRTDIRIRASTDTNGSIIHTRMHGVLIDDDS